MPLPTHFARFATAAVALVALGCATAPSSNVSASTPGRADCPGKMVCPATGELICVDRCPIAPSATSAERNATAPLAPWEPVDESFRGCEGACGARVAGGSPVVIAQPGVRAGQQTYCFVSGVVVLVKDSSPRRDVRGASVYFCCEACAAYFSENRDRVIASRRT